MDFYIISTYNKCMQLKKNKFVLIILGVWIVLVALFCMTPNFIIKTNAIENVFVEKVGLKYEAVNLKTNFDIKTRLNISADKIYIYDKNKKTCFFEIDNPKISVNVFSLLFGKINLKKFNSDNLIVNIKRDEKGNIDLINSFKIKPDEFSKYKLTKLNSEIKNIRFTFQDDYIVKSKTKLSLNDSFIIISQRKNLFLIKEKGTIETSINNKTPQISDLDLNIASKTKSNDYSFSAYINNVNLYLLTEFAKKYISKEINYMNGNADLKITTDDIHKLNLKISNLSLVLKDNKIIKPFKEIDLNSEFNINKDKITIKKLSAVSNELFAIFEGEITKPFSKKPETNFSVELRNTQINNFFHFIPDDLIFYRPQGIPSLKKSNFHGVANGKINVKLYPLDVSGNIKVENVHIPGYPKPYHQNDVSLYFMKDKMRVYTRVYTPDNEYVIVDGISNLDDSLYGKYTVKSTKKIDLKFAQLYLVPIQQIIGFNIGPVPIMDIKGYGNIDIKTQGTIKDAQIFGYFNSYSAEASIKGLGAKLTNGSCKLIFDNRNLIFKEIKGLMDGSDFILTGVGNTKGDVDLKTEIKNAYLTKMLNIFNNSNVTKQYTPLLNNISAVSGTLNTQINLKGNIKDFENEDFLNELKPEGNFEFKNNKIILNNGFLVKNIKGVFNFSENTGQSGALEFYLGDSKFSSIFETKTKLSQLASGEDFDVNLMLNSQKLSFKDIIKELKNSKVINQKNVSDFIEASEDINFYSKISLNTIGKLSLKNIDLKKLKTKGYIVGLNSSKNKNIIFEQGLVRIDNNNLLFDNFKMRFFDGIISAAGSSQNGLKLALKNINLDKFDKFVQKIKLQNAVIKSGDITVKKDNIKLSAINIDYNKMPLIINLSTKLNSKVNNFEADFSTILNETTTDYVINPYLSYPIKIKGEVPLKGKFYGNLNNYTIDFKTSLPKEADISFSGGNIGDATQEREITGKINVNKNVLTLNNLKLIKYIKNQNNKLNPMLVINLNGKMIQKDNTIYYDNFKILTTNPVNVRVLNLIFKKSILKKGNFECNISLNGNIQSPKILGKADLQDLDIPLYDTQINNIKVNFSQNYINANVRAKNKKSDIQSEIVAINKFESPFVINKIMIDSNSLNIEDITQSLPAQNSKTDISKKQDFTIKPQDMIIKDGNFNFENVVFGKINAKNLKGNFSYKDNLFDLKNIIFDIAQGQINAKGSYGLNSTKLNLKADIKDCDANILAKDFLNIQGQIFGNMTGTIDLSAKNLNTPEGIKNVESNVNFAIDNGKMPKLGSLEYLLRAGNILRNGILGLSLNNLIQVLTPYKTGEFEKISGSLNVSKGEVKNLEVFSKGKNLSMYLFGKYSILENIADIQIYGRLSQNVSTALGAVGNISVKQFINSFSKKLDASKNQHIQEYLDKVPLVDGSDQGGYFSVKVYGDINKDDYVKKFSWE